METFGRVLDASWGDLRASWSGLGASCGGLMGYVAASRLSKKIKTDLKFYEEFEAPKDAKRGSKWS